MSWLALVFALEAGFLPSGGFVIYEAPEVIDVTGSFYVDMQAEVMVLDHLYVQGGVKNMMWSQSSDWTFWPHTDLYNFGAGVRWKWFDIGWRHYCVHPVTPYLILYDPVLKAEGAWDEVFIRVSGKIGGRK